MSLLFHNISMHVVPHGHLVHRYTVFQFKGPSHALKFLKEIWLIELNFLTKSFKSQITGLTGQITNVPKGSSLIWVCAWNEIFWTEGQYKSSSLILTAACQVILRSWETFATLTYRGSSWHHIQHILNAYTFQVRDYINYFTMELQLTNRQHYTEILQYVQFFSVLQR